MAAADEIFDSLPYIDTEPTKSERDRIIALLNSDIPANAHVESHPSLPPLAEFKFSPIIASELERVEGQSKLEAIDQSRYEIIEAPEGEQDSTAWRKALQQAYAAHSYLTNRRENLELLDEYGKNSWLLGNYQLEHQLKAIEKELVEAREAIETVNKERKQAQEQSRGELESLDETWRAGVGRILEIEVANEQLRQAALDARRQGAVG